MREPGLITVFTAVFLILECGCTHSKLLPSPHPNPSAKGSRLSESANPEFASDVSHVALRERLTTNDETEIDVLLEPLRTSLHPDEQRVIDVFEGSAPSTVFIAAKRQPVSFHQESSWVGTGSGFVWDRLGHIVTNYHVVDGFQDGEFIVTLFNQEVLFARYIGGDPQKDIAVLRIRDRRRAASLPPVQVLPSTLSPKVGQIAIAIGNPYGLGHTLTLGVVSAIRREVPGYGQVTIRGMIQTDASINPGNSGGPLLDSRGYLIGMNTMVVGNSNGIGFAVDSRAISRVVPQIVETGRAVHPGLGVDPVPDHLTRAAGISGVVVRAVLPGSPAEKVGIRGIHPGTVELGDTILALNGKDTPDYDSLYTALDEHNVGDEVELVVLRKGKKLRLRVRLADIQG